MKRILIICLSLVMVISSYAGTTIENGRIIREDEGPTLSKEEKRKQDKLEQESRKQAESRKLETLADDGKKTAEELPGPHQKVIVEESMSAEEKAHQAEYPGREIVKQGQYYYCLNSLGEKVRGWQQVDNNFDGTPEWYYFNIEGKMVLDDITPDGYFVNEFGRWIQSANNAYDDTTKGWKYGYPSEISSKSKTRYLWYKETNNINEALTPGKWKLIDTDGDGLYYWYYFDVDGFRVEGKTLTFQDDELILDEVAENPLINRATKYTFDKQGRWLDDSKVPVGVFRTANGDVSVKNLDDEYQQRSKVLLGQGVVLDLTGERTGTANVIFGKKYSQLELFMRKINLDKSSSKFEKRIQSKDISFRDSALGYYTVANCLYLPGSSCTIVIDVSGYKKISFDIANEYNNRTNVYTSDVVDLFIYKNGELLDQIDKSELYLRQDSPFFHWEDEWEKSDNVKTITLTYNTNLSKMGLILTNGALTKFGKDDEDTYDVDENDENYDMYNHDKKDK